MTRYGTLALALMMASCGAEGTSDLGLPNPSNPGPSNPNNPSNPGSPSNPNNPSSPTKLGIASTESQALTASSDGKAIFVVSAFENMLTRVDLADRSTTFFPLEGEPSRITRVQNLILVSLRAARQVALFRETESGLEDLGRVDVGAEPIGIVAQEGGSAFYVASSMSGLVQEFDLVTREVLRTWEMPGQPRSLVLHPNGKVLYVAGTFGGQAHWIDLGTAKASPMEFRAHQVFSQQTGDTVPAAMRITGDMAITPDGKLLGIPMLVIDAETPIPEAGGMNDEPDRPRPPEGGYSKRADPVVTLVPLDEEGHPELAQDAILGISMEELSYISSVRFSPDGSFIAAAMESVNRVVLLATEPGLVIGRRETGPVGTSGIGPESLIMTAAGPSSVLFTSKNQLEIYAFLDRSVASVDLEDPLINKVFVEIPAQQMTTVAHGDLPADVERGRRLFYAANDPRVSRPGSAISCSTCHFEGRTDGLSWPFERGLRQTPSLAGLISIKEPVGWAGQAETVAIDAMNTSQGLMGGLGLQMKDADDIAAYIDWSRPVDLPMAGSLNEQARRGEAIFNRSDIGCMSCHNGALFSDGQKHDLLGFAGVKTPSLLGVSATPPYFHDGSATTLREVILRTNEKAVSSDLSESEIEDLIGYLRTL